MAAEDEDRRSAEDRRQGDRRSGDGENYEGEERRKGDRRSGEERRKEERKNLTKIAIYGLVGCLIPIGILMALSQLQPPVRKRSGARKLERDTLQVEETRPAPKTKPKPEAPKKTGIEMLRDDLLALAPDLYHGVKLESLISKSDPTAVDSTATVEAIEFLVKGEKWDTMGGTDKVVILNKTFSFLKRKFPFLTRTVRLIFDDGRPDLDLKFE